MRGVRGRESGEWGVIFFFRMSEEKATWDCEGIQNNAPLYFTLSSSSLVLKARHLGGSAFNSFHRLGVPEQALLRILRLL